MKIIASLLIALCFCLGAGAQESDSVILDAVRNLENEISSLKTGQRRLSSQLVSSSRDQAAALEETNAAVTENRQAIGETEAKVSALEQVVERNKGQADEEREILAGWTRQMLIILAAVFVVLLVILLILIIINRGRIKKDYLKLEAKVDNTRDALELEIKNVMKKHEDDIAALTASGKKPKP